MLEILSSSPALLYEVTGYVVCVGLLLTFALFTTGRQAADALHFLPLRAGWEQDHLGRAGLRALTAYDNHVAQPVPGVRR